MQHPLQISRRIEYGLRAMLFLASQPVGIVVPFRQIATRMDVPQDFLAKILKRLVKGKLNGPSGLAFDRDAPASPAGSKQVTSYDGVTYGYKGPCPPATHVYRFQLYGLNIATLPGVTTGSTRPQLQTAINGRSIGSTSLVGSYP